MLAGMLSVLLVAGMIGLGVFLATDEPRRRRRDRDDRARPPAPPTAATPTPARVGDLPPVKIKTLPAAAKAAGCTSRSPPDQGVDARGARVHGRRLQLQPADVGHPLPELVPGRRLRARHTPELGKARARARARPHRDPVQAGHAGRDRRPARGARRRARRRLPHPAVRERTKMPLRGRRDRLGPPARLPEDERQGLRRAARVPGTTSTRAPRRSRSRALAAARRTRRATTPERSARWRQRLDARSTPR